MMKFQAELKLQDKLENVERVARVNEFHRLQTLRRIYEQNTRYKGIQEQKMQLVFCASIHKVGSRERG